MIFGLPDVLSVMLISLGISFMVSLIYRFLANQNDIRQLKLDMKDKQAKMKELQKTNPQEANKVATEMMALSSKQMRINMKPMLMTLVVIGLTLPFMWQLFPGDIVSLPFSLPILGSSLNWFWWYFVISIPFGILFRKLLGVEM